MNEIIYLNGRGPPEYEPHVYTGDQSYDKILTDGNFGMGLKKRGPEDNVLLFFILSEDDGHLFETRMPAPCWSTFWLPHLMRFHQQCEEWLVRNCDRSTFGEYSLK